MDAMLTERNETIAQMQLQVETTSANLKASERKIRLLEENLIEKEMHVEELMSIKKKDFEDFRKVWLDINYPLASEYGNCVQQRQAVFITFIASCVPRVFITWFVYPCGLFSYHMPTIQFN